MTRGTGADSAPVVIPVKIAIAFVPGVPQAGDVTQLLHENLRQVPLWNTRVRLHRNTLDSLESLGEGDAQSLA